MTVWVLMDGLTLLFYDVCLRCLLILLNIKDWLFSSEKKVGVPTFLRKILFLIIRVYLKAREFKKSSQGSRI